MIGRNVHCVNLILFMPDPRLKHYISWEAGFRLVSCYSIKRLLHNCMFLRSQMIRETQWF
jgi:hypothetical protein